MSARRRAKGGGDSPWEGGLAPSEGEVRKDLLREARAVGMPEGQAKGVADKVVPKLMRWITKREQVTEDDVNRMMAEMVEPYSWDLAYVYKNRDKII